MLVLHIGFPKTGSSALQLALARNARALSDRGVFYADPPVAPGARHALFGGNGGPLAGYLRPDDDAPMDGSAFEASFRKTFVSDRHPISLVSAEDIGLARRAPLERFRDVIAAGMDVRIVAFARDIYPHARSVWIQKVQWGYGRDFLTYCRDHYANPQCRGLRMFRKAFGPERVSVLHYDTVRGDILGAFLGAIGVDAGGLAPTERVNRGLTQGELSLMLALNRIHGSRAVARALSYGLLSTFPQRRGRPHWSAAEAAYLQDRFGEEVDWINARMFKTGPKLRVAPPPGA